MCVGISESLNSMTTRKRTKGEDATEESDQPVTKSSKFTTTSPVTSSSSNSNSNTRQSAVSPDDNDQRITVIVGGVSYATLRCTLVEGSPYFESRLSGQFSESSDIRVCHVDRDGEPFAYILQYLRCGKLLLPVEKKSMLAAVLVEAEYFGLDSLLQQVKIKCFCNLNSTKGMNGDYEEAMEGANEMVLSDMLETPHFPDMYYGPVSYFRVISVHAYPPQTYVKVQRFQILDDANDVDEFLPCFESITYECVADKRIFVEPLVSYTHYSQRQNPSWTHLTSCTDWPEEFTDADWMNQDRPKIQCVPITFWLGANRYRYWLNKWGMATKSIHQLSTDDERAPYTCRGVDGETFQNNAEFAEIFHCSSGNVPKLFNFGPTNKYTDVSTFSNFLHMGVKKPEDDDE